eukprot:GHVL01024779.1.p1 GENE.GHVL01024779.1~~GHVL01024779.1.p1  ORF type:complete len:212 (+),score=7.50 GHVL01024779.1:436-1071(+)
MGSFAGLLTLLLALFTFGSFEEPITCDAGQFTAGETAAVTCNFPEMIKDSGHRIFIQHYPFSAPQHFSGDDVLKCSSLDQTKPLCTVAKGCRFNDDISNRVTLNILEVKKDFAGQYVCQIVPPDGRPIHACNLTVNEEVSVNSTTGLTPPDNGTKTLPKSGSTNIAKYIAISVTIAILLCNVVVVFIAIWNRSQEPKAHKQNLDLTLRWRK